MVGLSSPIVKHKQKTKPDAQRTTLTPSELLNLKMSSLETRIDQLERKMYDILVLLNEDMK